MYKVKQSDLVGNIAGFPIEVVQKMIDIQVEQGNRADISVFQEKNSAARCSGGFDFDDTVEGHDFWIQVTNFRNFDLFFEKYPGKNVYYRGVEGRGDEVIKALEKLGGKRRKFVDEERENFLYYINMSNDIRPINDNDFIGDILQRGFTELFLPEIETVDIDGKKFRKDEIVEIIKEKGLKEIKS